MKKIAFTIITLLCFCYLSYSQSEIKAKNGILDLRNWNFSANACLNLDGQWKFYWKQLLTPEQISDSIEDEYELMNLPCYWNGFKYKDQEVTGAGYGTFSLTILVDSNVTSLALDFREIMTSYKCFVNNKIIAEVGIVGTSQKESKAHLKPLIKSLEISSDTIEIVFQVSNFSHVHGGFFATPKIGTIEKIAETREKNIAWDIFLFGAILIMSIYHFGLFLISRKRVTALYFGLLTLFTAIRTLVTGTEFFSIMFDNISWELSYRIEYITFFLAPPAYLSFMYFNFKEEVHKNVLIGITILSLISCLSLFLPSSIFTMLATPYQIVVLMIVLYSAYILILALKRKREGIVVLTISLVIFFLCAVNDVLYVQNIFKTIELLPFGIFIFILGQSYLLAIRFNKDFIQNAEMTITLDYQNKNLEKIVKERTKEIEFQNNEIIEKNEELLQQNEEILTQRDEISKINHELEKLSIVASRTDNAVVICDKEANIQWINEGFTRLYGYDLDKLKTTFGKNIINVSSNSNISDLIAKCIENKETVIYESNTQTATGEKIWVQTTITPIIDYEGEVTNLIAIDSDIRKLKEAENKITQQKEILEFQHGQIKSSINYASTIQKAILPIKENIDKYFDNFIIFRPKDVVSGDFYWFTNIENFIFFAVVDCTGHGVPGAFMSMIGSRLLNEIVLERKVFETEKILECLDLEIKRSLHQKESENSDGMDICLCRFEYQNNNNIILSFSGAKRPLFYCKANSNIIEQLKATRRSIGGLSSLRNKQEFFSESISIRKDDILYLTSDGFVDQNNTERKRFSTNQLLNILHEIALETLENQKIILEEFLSRWMINEEQRDDITFVGIKIK